MKVNYKTLGQGRQVVDNRHHAEWLAGYGNCGPGTVSSERERPAGYEDFIVVDVLGSEFVWMNDTFTQDRFTWYLWFESVFLVPREMAAILALRWS